MQTKRIIEIPLVGEFVSLFWYEQRQRRDNDNAITSTFDAMLLKHVADINATPHSRAHNHQYRVYLSVHIVIYI